MTINKCLLFTLGVRGKSIRINKWVRLYSKYLWARWFHTGHELRSGKVLIFQAAFPYPEVQQSTIFNVLLLTIQASLLIQQSVINTDFSLYYQSRRQNPGQSLFFFFQCLFSKQTVVSVTEHEIPNVHLDSMCLLLCAVSFQACTVMLLPNFLSFVVLSSVYLFTIPPTSYSAIDRFVR